MTRGLYAWLFEVLDGCIPFRTLLDTEGGLRRMDRPEKAEWQVLVTFGRLVRGPIPGYEHVATERQTVTFSIWVRDEAPVPGDLMLEDIQDRLMRALGVWRRAGVDPMPNQTCDTTAGILVQDAEHLDGDSEPFYDDAMQAWTKEIRIRFLVMLATCRPVEQWCGPCGDAAAELAASG